MAVPGDVTARQDHDRAIPGFLQLHPTCSRQMGGEVTPAKARPRLPPLGFALTLVTLTSSLGPAAARGASFVAPARGTRVSPSGR